MIAFLYDVTHILRKVILAVCVTVAKAFGRQIFIIKIIKENVSCFYIIVDANDNDVSDIESSVLTT